MILIYYKTWIYQCPIIQVKSPSIYMVSRPGLGSDPPIGSDRDSGRDSCIAECYIAEEAIKYCSEYLSNMKAVGIPSMRNEYDGQESIGKPLSSSQVFRPDAKEFEQAHLYVLENTIEV